MTSQTDLTTNIDKLHTTEMGVERIKRNLKLTTEDVVAWCKVLTQQANEITLRGKNWYVRRGNAVLTVNAHSYTIITAKIHNGSGKNPYA